MILEDLWGNFSYVFALFAALVLVGYKMPHRSHFFIRVTACFVFVYAFSFGYDRLLELFELDVYVRLFFRTLNSFLVYVSTIAATKICFLCNFWGAFFCGTAGYCMQHISRRLFDLVPAWPNTVVAEAALCLITAAFYAAVYLLAVRKNDYDGIMTDNKIQISVAFCVVSVTIFLNSFASRVANSAGAYDVTIYIRIFSIITAALSLFVEFGLLQKRNVEVERDTLKKIMYQEREHYVFEKSLIDTINMKCHDLKHQLSGFGGLPTEEKQKIDRILNLYDSSFNTGNASLDIMLTIKSLVCEQKNIRITCLADGRSLNFMSEADIYSLFGNILDNAIEAVEKLTDVSKKVIGVTVSREKNFVIVCAENYYEDDIVLVDGLPRSTKPNDPYHGFGLKSIALITKKYNGDFKIATQDNIFVLDIVFPC